MAFCWVQFAPGNPAEVLITSADSQIRVFDNVTMVQKFRGTEIITSQNILKKTKKKDQISKHSQNHACIHRQTKECRKLLMNSIFHSCNPVFLL